MPTRTLRLLSNSLALVIIAASCAAPIETKNGDTRKVDSANDAAKATAGGSLARTDAVARQQVARQQVDGQTVNGQQVDGATTTPEKAVANPTQVTGDEPSRQARLQTQLPQTVAEQRADALAAYWPKSAATKDYAAALEELRRATIEIESNDQIEWGDLRAKIQVARSEAQCRYDAQSPKR